MESKNKQASLPAANGHPARQANGASEPTDVQVARRLHWDLCYSLGKLREVLDYIEQGVPGIDSSVIAAITLTRLMDAEKTLDHLAEVLGTAPWGRRGGR
jgi:hypothetical protein